MNTTSKSIKVLITSQLLSIIFVIIGRVNISLLLAYSNSPSNSIIPILSLVFFAIFCIIISILFLNENLINIILVSVSYVIYWLVFGSKIFLFQSDNNPNDFGAGILGLPIEILVGFFQYIIVIVATIIATSIHKINNALKNRD